MRAVEIIENNTVAVVGTADGIVYTASVGVPGIRAWADAWRNLRVDQERPDLEGQWSTFFTPMPYSESKDWRLPQFDPEAMPYVRGITRGAINARFCPCQEKFYTVVLRGVGNVSETPVKSP